MYPGVDVKFLDYKKYISQHYGKSDWLFWHNCISLNDQVKSIDSIEGLMGILSDKRINKEAALQVPKDAFSSSEVARITRRPFDSCSIL